MRQTPRAELLNVNEKERTISYIMNRCLVTERRESKCCAVLLKHCRKVKGEQVLILQIDQQLKIKNNSDVSGQLFCCQSKENFLLETDEMY